MAGATNVISGVRVLGPLRVADGGREIELRGQKHRALLAFLVLHAGEVISIDRLVDELWGERPPRTARNSLQNHVWQLRKLLGADALQTRPPGYVLEVDPEAVDAARFVRLLERARGAAAAERAETLRNALALWRGRALADLEFEPFALAEAPRLDELRAAAGEELVAAELELGRDAELVARIEELVAAHPLRERLRAQLMLALYRSGRQADALAAYRAARRTLVAELGIEPGHALRALEAAILRQDPALDAPAEAASEAVDLRERRTTATILFAEIAVQEEPDPERHRALALRAAHELRAATEYHGGTVERLAGDELVAVFGVPARHEDDPLRAVRAALQIARALRESPELEARIALDTGEVIAPTATSRAPVVGAPLSRAKRLAEAAPPGLVVAALATQALVGDAVQAKPMEPLTVRGQEAAVGVVQIASVVEERAGRRIADTPLVGRDEELAALRTAFDRAVESGRSEIFGVLGEPGVGKTRLARELAAVIGDAARVLVGRCVPYGEGATWLPLREIVRAGESDVAEVLAETDEGERAARILQTIVGVDDAEVSVHDAFWAARRYLEALARQRPLLVVLDDVHWAEPTFLEFVEQLAATPAEEPMLVLVLSRPELAEERAALRSLELEPLGDADGRRLVDSAAPESLSGELRRRIAVLAEGNPLFAEQLIAYTEERGEDALSSVPPTVEAVLASRLDRIAADERAVLARAAVVGREFWQTAVLSLTPELEVPAVGRHLEQLAQRGLIHRARATSGSRSKDAFRFHHVLIRDVAYGAIPKAERSDLHERAAEWLESQAAGEDEIVGYHLEQAYRCHVEIGAVDRRARSLAADAGERLAAAGIRSWKRGDAPAACNLLGRATALLPENDPERAALLCELGIAQRTAGDIGSALRTIGSAVETARDGRVKLRAQVELAGMRLFADPEGRADELLDVAAAGLAAFEELNDHRALGRTWLLIGYVQGGLRCHNAAWEDAAQRALTHYERSGWPVSTPLKELAAALLFGPTPAPKAIARCNELLQIDADLGARANVKAILGVLEGMRGRFTRARGLIDDAERAYEGLGQVTAITMSCRLMRAAVDTLAGDLGAAENELRWTCERMRTLSESVHLATASSDLADVLYGRGSMSEADEWTRVAEAHAATDDIGAQFCWRSVRAKILAERGSFSEAEALVREAVGLAERTDALNQRAKVQLDLAEVLRRAERADEADAALRKAVGLYRRKGNLAAFRRAKNLLPQPARA